MNSDKMSTVVGEGGASLFLARGSKREANKIVRLKKGCDQLYNSKGEKNFALPQGGDFKFGQYFSKILKTHLLMF